MSYEQERQEAIEAGQDALNALHQAEDYLKSARNWGILDILGGGLVINILKHSKMEKAKVYMERAKWSLERFGKELNDVAGYVDLDFNTTDFLNFADYFFDGFLADLAMQSRINKARDRVDEAIWKVEDILRRL